MMQQAGVTPETDAFNRVIQVLAAALPPTSHPHRMDGMGALCLQVWGHSKNPERAEQASVHTYALVGTCYGSLQGGPGAGSDGPGRGGA